MRATERSPRLGSPPQFLLDGTSFDGGKESTWVRVDPAAGDAWFATGCYRLWRWTPAD